MLDSFQSQLAKTLKRQRNPLVTIASVLTIGGSVASLVTIPSLNWQTVFYGLLLVVWLVFGTLLIYNKLNKISRRIDHAQRLPEPGEYVYIEGEDAAMETLMAATKRARKSICSTRFFPCAIHGRHDRYAASIRGRVLGDDEQSPLKVYYRIVAANKPEKLEDVKKYIRDFHGKPFKLFLTHKSNSFELVIIDEQETFIHFYGRDSVIGSTLYLPGFSAAKRFRDVFDRLRNRSFDETIEVIDCEHIQEKDIEFQIRRVSNYFALYVPPVHRDHLEIEEILNPTRDIQQEANNKGCSEG